MAAQDPFIGREILGGQFKILEKIGTGGMGSVYKASQPEMNRMVGVKILHPKLNARKDLVSRFRREARAMSHLTHPNTVRVLLYGELEDGSLYIIMEFLEGKNLNQLVRTEGPLAAARAIGILSQACGALDEAHKAGIIHRDLKPENIFVCQQGGIKDFAKVLDFGLAKVSERELRPGSIMLTQEGMVFGTPEFMSPEQAQGHTLTPASDIYSLAMILYEALTGKLPFEARGTMEFLQAQVLKKPIPLNSRVPGRTFSPELEAVLTKAMEKPVEARYGTATEFSAALEATLVNKSPSSRPNPLGQAVVPAVTHADQRGRDADPRAHAVEASGPTSGSNVRPAPAPSEHPPKAPSKGPPMAIIAFSCIAIGALLALVFMKFVK